MNPIIEAAFLDELEKISGILGRFAAAGPAVDVAGLGILAAPNIDNMIAKHRARKAGLVDSAGKPTEEGIESKRFIKEKWHDPVEAGGLGLLAAPTIAGRIAHGKWGH